LRISTQAKSPKEGPVEQDERDRDRDQENLDEQMERDAEIRRDTQVRGSLGIPPSGERDESIPEFGRMDDEDRKSER
jgi:hypothetical protein